jgi:ribonucleotide reductase alpha subunit
MKKEIYWLNKEAITFLERGYLAKGQTALERIRQIAESAEKILNKKGFADKFEDYMYKGWYSLSSPVWANFGSGRGLSISCNGSYVSDNMASILEKTAEVGMLTKYGAGTSGYFGELRGRGASISVGGSSSGPVHFMELFDGVTRVVSQSNVRRGSFAAYLPIDHPDIEEFLDIREEGHAIQDLSIGVCVPDYWMKKMVAGDKDCRKIWARVIKKRFESGYPYIFFTDNVNNNAPQVYKDKNMKIYASNLCLVGDTIVNILINDKEKRQIQIKDVGFYVEKYKNVKVESFDFNTQTQVYSEITNFAQTGESVEIIEIEDETGNIIQCTPEHKIYTKNRGYVEAQHLEETDILQNLK